MTSPPPSAQPVFSSSPGLPAIEDIIAKAPRRTALRSGNHAAAIPDDARLTFTSASEVLRQAPEIDIETEKITKSPARRAKPVRRKPASAKPAEQPVLGRAGSYGSLSPGEKPWQRYQSRGSPGDGSPSPSRIGIYGGPTDQVDKGKLGVQTMVVSKHFAHKKGEECLTNGDPIPELPSLAAAPLSPQPAALSRRKDWTPPPVDSVIVLDSESDAKEMLSSASKAPQDQNERRKLFETLKTDFGCKSESVVRSRQSSAQAEVLGKRKLIETVSTSASATGERTSRSVSPVKPAKTKRKVRTITELATAPYAAPPEPDFNITAGHTRDSLLGYLDQGGDVKAMFEVQKDAISKAKGGKKAPPKKPRKKKAGTAEAPILLSPTTALRQSKHQDFVFGTSSQLIMDESPRALKELHLAMQASNKAEEGDNDTDERPGLWHAGARDGDGSLLEFRYVTSSVHAPSSPPPPPALQQTAEASTQPGVPYPSAAPSINNEMVSEVSAGSAQVESGSGGLEDSTTPVKQAAPAAASGSVTKSKTPRKTKKPNYDLLTDVQLARKIKSFGFKPIKRRSAMISLLDQCWTSQQQAMTPPRARAMSTTAAAASPTKAEKSAATKADAPVKKPRGRPKKVVDPAPAHADERSKSPSTPKRPRGRPPKATKAAPIEIPDSDEILDERIPSPSSPKDDSAPEDVFSSPAAVDMSTMDEADMSLALSPTDNEELLFKQITEAVKSAPRSKNPAEPSWHEKMLLYDPIVLEDFAAWLNAGELTKVGHDGEVSPSDVKKWCESKSIVCLWKQTTRGKERKRY